MFTELMLFCTTATIIVLGDHLSCAIGVVLLSILAYCCTFKRLRRFSYFSHRAKTAYLDTYIEKINIFLDSTVFSPKWHWFIKSFKFFFITKANKNYQPLSNQEELNLPFTNNFNSAKQCTETNSVDEEIAVIVDCILREYIKSWYIKVSKEEEFVADIHHVISNTLAAFYDEIVKNNKEEFLCHLLQIYLHYFHHFQEALRNVTEDGNLEICVSKKKDLHLNFKMYHWAMKDEVTEWTYLQTLMGTLIDSFGPKEFSSCPLLHTVVIEILAQNVMLPLVNMLTDSNRLNGWMKHLLLNHHKFESKHLLQEAEEVDKTSAIVPMNNFSTSMQKPEIVLSYHFPLEEAGDESDFILYSENAISTVDNPSPICQNTDASPGEISDTSIDSFKFEMETNAVCRSSFKKLQCNETIEQEETFQPTFLRTCSSKSISTKSLTFNAENSTDNSKFLNVGPLKRSHSADYIRQMLVTTALLPLNSSKLSIRYCQKTNKHFLQMKPGAISCDVEVAEEAMEKEMPPLISDIKITDTETRVDINDRSYTVYCIQYNGVFQKVSSESHFPDLVMQVINIKRRFREFLALQLMLEENPLVKFCLKGIKGPSKWFATPFSNLDKRNIAERKIFLELYLQQLLKQDIIIRSHELHEFLAYGGDASIEFVKKNLDIIVPRINKLLVRSVKGAFDLFRTAIPNISAETGMPQEPNLVSTEDSADESYVFEESPVYLLNYSKKNTDLKKKFEYIKKCFETVKDEVAVVDVAKSGSKRTSLLHHSHSINNKIGCQCDETAAIDTLVMKNQFTDICLNFCTESLTNAPFLHAFKLLPTSFIQSLLTQRLEGLGHEKTAQFLHLFHKTMWPEIKAKHHENKGFNEAAEVFEMMKSLLKEWSSTKQFFKVLMGPLLGSQSVFHSTELLLGSLQNEKLNRCLLFYILDAIIETTCVKK